MKKLCLAVAMLAWGVSHAATRTWTGLAGDNEWNTPGNWSGETLPTYGDTVRFTNDVPISVRLNKTQPFGKILRFEGKDVTFGSDGSRMTHYFSSSPTCEVYVVAGTTVTTSNTITMYNRSPLAKTGGGIFKILGHYNVDASKKKTSSLDNLPCLDIREGEFQSMSYDAACGAYLTNITNIFVRAGASLSHKGYNSFSDYTVFHLEKGAQMHLNTSGSQNKASAICGEGDLTLTANTTLQLDFIPSSCEFSGIAEFSGTVSGGTLSFVDSAKADPLNRKFIVGSPNSLKDAKVVDNIGCLAFAAQVGSFRFNSLAIPEGGVLKLEDEQDLPISLYVNYTDSSRPIFTGSGNLNLTGGIKALTNTQLQITGRISAEAGANLTLGNETDAGNVDLSKFSSINADGTLKIKNTAAAVYNKPFTGSGIFYNSTDLTLGDFRMNNADVHAVSNLVLAGGMADINYIRCDNKNAIVTFAGGMYCGGKSVGQFRSESSSLKTPYVIEIANSEPGTYRFTGGEAWLGNPYGNVSRLELFGGRCVLNTGFFPVENASTRVLFDGGRMTLSSRNALYWCMFPIDRQADFEVQVGSKGALIDSTDLPSAYNTDTHELRLNTPFVTAHDCQKDGGIVFDLRNTGSTLRPYRPFLLSGPFVVKDGRVALDYYSATWHSDLLTYPSFFGTGDFTLDSSILIYTDTSSTATLPEQSVLRLASGEGSKFTVSGSSAIRFRGHPGNADKPARTICVGNENASANSSLCFNRGGALFLHDASLFGGEDGSTLKVYGGVGIHENGMSKNPVFYEKYNAGHNEVLFTAYDSEKGFCPFEGSVSSFNDCEGKVVDSDGGSIAKGVEKSILALRVNDWVTLTIGEGSKLNIGNGIDPACLILEYQSHLAGSQGVIDFGASEGVIVVGSYYYDEGHSLSPKIEGQNGVSYVASSDYMNHSVRVSGANTYSGPTYISTAAVVVQNERAFSSGDVFVTGGHRNGGKVVFNRSLTVANNFHVSGTGHRMKSDWGTRFGGWGAMSFLTNDVVIAGNVEIDNAMMVSAKEIGNEGTFRGNISGGKLQVYPGKGRIVLTANNTYAGGTQIYRSTLVLGGESPTAGTGAVFFDDGVLRFENTKPIVFANSVEGVGTIELAGASVEFSSPELAGLPVKKLAAGSVIDIANIAASALVAAVGEGGFDLGGSDLTLYGVSGSGRIYGGTLTLTGCISPGGEGNVGTLVFEKSPVVNGATYLCDLIGEETDNITFEEDFDLSSLAFRGVRGESGYSRHRADVITCGGVLSSSFAVSELPKGRYNLHYLDKKVQLEKIIPLTIILR